MSDAVKSDVARLEGENAILKDQRQQLESQVKQLREQPISSQRMLLVYRDGRTENKPVMVEPDPSRLGYRPMRYFSTVDAPLYQVGVGFSWADTPHPAFYKRTFEVALNQALDSKLIVYIER